MNEGLEMLADSCIKDLGRIRMSFSGKSSAAGLQKGGGGMLSVSSRAVSMKLALKDRN